MKRTTPAQKRDPIAEAVAWLTATPRDQRPGPVVTQLRTRFGITTADAVEALRRFNEQMTRAA